MRTCDKERERSVHAGHVFISPSRRDEDLAEANCTIEEREEYEPHIAEGSIVYAGVDYGAILKRAEDEADVILWDGGNNDLPFFAPDLYITVVDSLRPGDESTYHPGEANLRLAQLVVIKRLTPPHRMRSPPSSPACVGRIRRR